MLNRAMRDLDGLRAKYAKAQNAVNGRALERPSEDPQRVVESMDLSGAKLRLQRSQRAGQDAREWLSVAENSMAAVIDRLQAAREMAVQAGSPSALDPEAREGIAKTLESIKQALLREVNSKHRDQYVFSGWQTDGKQPDPANPGQVMYAPPFSVTAAGDTAYFGVSVSGGGTYPVGTDKHITRDVAPGLSVPVNIPGNKLFARGDFLKAIDDLAAAVRAGDQAAISNVHLKAVDQALGNATVLRSELGIQERQVETYEKFAQESLFQIEDRLGKIGGTDLETAVLRMTEAQTAYQAALASFAKALPTSLLDYMLR